MVHTNVCGPRTITFLGGFWCYETVSDEFSQMILIYFKKTMDEVFSKFQEFKSHKENLTKKQILFFEIK